MVSEQLVTSVGTETSTRATTGCPTLRRIAFFAFWGIISELTVLVLAGCCGSSRSRNNDDDNRPVQVSPPPQRAPDVLTVPAQPVPAPDLSNTRAAIGSTFSVGQFDYVVREFGVSKVSMDGGRAPAGTHFITVLLDLRNTGPSPITLPATVESLTLLSPLYKIVDKQTAFDADAVGKLIMLRTIGDGSFTMPPGETKRFKMEYHVAAMRDRSNVAFLVLESGAPGAKRVAVSY